MARTKVIVITVTITGASRAAAKALSELLSNCQYDKLPVTIAATEDNRLIAKYEGR